MKILFLLFLAIGCQQHEASRTSADPLHDEAKTRKCTDEQLDRVKKQIIICSDTGYFDSHCYDMAIVGQCEKPESVIIGTFTTRGSR